MWPWSTGYSTSSIAEVSSPLNVTAGSSTKSLAHHEYDYIIVGAGTAGCVLASRLSEDPNVSVLLIERGPVVNSWKSRVPLLSMYTGQDIGSAYKGQSAGIKTINGRGVRMISGKAMGGTSKINAFLYTRPFAGELDAWAKSGRKGWSWADMEPLLIRSEKTLTHTDSPHRGTQGLWVNRAPDELYFESTKRFIDAGESLGIPFFAESNRPEGPTVCSVRVDRTIDAQGRRVSTFDAFLPPELVYERRGHLKICPNAIVTSLDIRNLDNEFKVKGVFLEADSEPGSPRPPAYYAVARKEVILCSGAIANPQLLMLSGVGPRRHLENMGIYVIKEHPGIGQHLQDHAMGGVSYTVPSQHTIQYLQESRLFVLKELLRYIFLGEGVFLAPLPEMTLFARSALLNDKFEETTHNPSEVDAKDPKNIPDIEIMFVPAKCRDIPMSKSQGTGYVGLLPVVLQPKSTGKVLLKSKDPRERPLCHLGFLKHGHDRRVMRKGVKLCVKLASRMQQRGYSISPVHIPSSGSDRDIDDFLDKYPMTSYHYSSTCRMAPEDDPTSPGVVDDELRVHGIKGLRIADASIFPNILATHLQAPAVMVAEKCADLVKSTLSTWLR